MGNWTDRSKPVNFDGFIGGITGFGTILYLQRLEKLQSAGGVALRLEATQMSINAPRLASKGPKKFSFQDFLLVVSSNPKKRLL